MRTSLLPGLFEALRRARRHGQSDMRLFTVGSRFCAAAPGERLPDERPSFAAVLAGARSARLEKPSDVDVWDAKGIAVEVAERVTGRRADVAHQAPALRAPYLHPRGAADVRIDGETVGCFGPLHPDVADALDVAGACVLVELDLRALDKLGKKIPAFRPIPALPAATRDLSVVVHDDVPAGAVAAAIREAGRELCESVDLFDLFRGGALPADHRSLTYHVVYRDPKSASDPQAARTLTDAEVDARHNAVIAVVQTRFGAMLRA